MKLDVGRTLALALIGLALVGAATVLWLAHLDTPAAAVFSLAEAVVVGGFGIVIGEHGAAGAGS